MPPTRFPIALREYPSADVMADIDPIYTLLRTLREARGLSLTQVEDASNGKWKPGAVGSWERGARNPPLPVLRALLAFYDFRLVALPVGIYEAPETRP